MFESMDILAKPDSSAGASYFRVVRPLPKAVCRGT